MQLATLRSQLAAAAKRKTAAARSPAAAPAPGSIQPVAPNHFEINLLLFKHLILSYILKMLLWGFSTLDSELYLVGGNFPSVESFEFHMVQRRINWTKEGRRKAFPRVRRTTLETMSSHLSSISSYHQLFFCFFYDMFIISSGFVRSVMSFLPCLGCLRPGATRRKCHARHSRAAAGPQISRASKHWMSQVLYGSLTTGCWFDDSSGWVLVYIYSRFI